VKGQGRRRDPEPFGDDPGRQSLGAARNEQPEQIEPSLLGERGKRRDRALLIHCSFDPTTNIEILTGG
jgi:hypothetical protein